MSPSYDDNICKFCCKFNVDDLLIEEVARHLRCEHVHCKSMKDKCSSIAGVLLVVLEIF